MMVHRRQVLTAAIAICASLTMCSCRSPRIVEAREALAAELAERRAARTQSVALYQEGLEDYQAGDPDKARMHLVDSVEADERNARGWMLLGVIEYENDKLFEAASAFRRAARLEPMRYEPHFNIGAVLEKAGRYEQAIESYETALKLAPDELAVMENLARCYIRTETKLSVAKELIAQALPREARPEWRIWLAEQLRCLEGVTLQALPPGATGPSSEAFVSHPRFRQCPGSHRLPLLVHFLSFVCPGCRTPQFNRLCV